MQTVVFKEKMLFVMMQNMVGGSLKTFGEKKLSEQHFLKHWQLNMGANWFHGTS